MSDLNQESSSASDKLQIVHVALWAVKESYVGTIGLEMQVYGEFKPVFTIVSLPEYKMKVRFNDDSYIVLDHLSGVVIRYPYPPQRLSPADLMNELDELKATGNQLLSDYSDVFERNKSLEKRNEKLEKEYNALARLVSFSAKALESAHTINASHAEKDGQMRLIACLLTDALNDRDVSSVDV